MIEQWLTPVMEWFGIPDLITLVAIAILIVLVIKVLKD